ncbi:hypothetical protein PV325_009554, partial [Microctonus aethiopoides]
DEHSVHIECTPKIYVGFRATGSHEHQFDAVFRARAIGHIGNIWTTYRATSLMFDVVTAQMLPTTSGKWDGKKKSNKLKNCRVIKHLLSAVEEKGEKEKKILIQVWADVLIKS